MNILTAFIIYPAVLFVVSLITIYLWGYTFAFIMSGVSALFFSYVNLTSKGIMGNGTGGNSYVGDFAVLLLAVKVFIPFLAYALGAAYVASYSHAIQLFWPYFLFIIFSILGLIIYFKNI